jgi:hypothetical protein
MDVNSDASGGADEGQPRCSARGCREPATTVLGWRNPRLHDGARIKNWLACPRHEPELAAFLERRRFLLSRSNLDTSR